MQADGSSSVPSVFIAMLGMLRKDGADSIPTLTKLLILEFVVAQRPLAWQTVKTTQIVQN